MGAEDKYDDPVKQLSRMEQLSFERKHLGYLDPKKIKVVYLPGPKNHEWQIYKQLGIRPKKALGLENDTTSFEILKQNTHGINIEFTSYQKHFEKLASLPDAGYNIISLDTEGQSTQSFSGTLDTIFMNNLIKTPGVLVTNIYGQREKEEVKSQYIIMESFRRMRAAPKELEPFELSKDDPDFVNVTPLFPKVEEKPLELRSDSISEVIRELSYSYEASKESNLAKLEFVRKYFPHITADLSFMAEKIVQHGKDEGEREVAAKLLEDSLSLEEALLQSYNLKINLGTKLLHHLSKACMDNFHLTYAIHVAVTDPVFVSEHQRLQYTSQTGAKMYMDLVALNRVSTSHLGSIIQDFKKRIRFKDGRFMVAGRLFTEGHKSLKKARKTLDKNMEALINVYKRYSDGSRAYEFDRDRRELKLKEPSVAKTQANKKQKKEPEQISQETQAIRKLEKRDLIPSKFFERLPENYQKRIECFVEQINQERIDGKILSALDDSKWYRHELLPEIDFYAFWDGIYLKTRLGEEISKESVKTMWEESKNRSYVEHRKIGLEERVNGLIDRKHPLYEKERIEVIRLLDEGQSIEKIRELKPMISKRSLGGIVAWYNHRDSWEKPKGVASFLSKLGFKRK